METPLDGKKCLVTGATSGLGLAAARDLARRGAEVVVVGRSEEKAARAAHQIAEEAGNGRVTHLAADLASMAQVRSLAAAYRDAHDRLDLLVNNAGAIYARRQTSPDGFELTFAVNHLAPFLLTNLLLDRLVASAPSRVVTTASGAEAGGDLDWDDLAWERRYGWLGFPAYARSKLCNVLFTRELGRRLDGRGVVAHCFHPGFVRSGFANNNGRTARWLTAALSPFARSPERAAETLVWLATSPEAGRVTGGYWYDAAPYESSALGRDMDAAKRLWEVSERMVGLCDP